MMRGGLTTGGRSDETTGGRNPNLAARARVFDGCELVGGIEMGKGMNRGMCRELYSIDRR
jgi:hypothetical protein